MVALSQGSVVFYLGVIGARMAGGGQRRWRPALSALQLALCACVCTGCRAYSSDDIFERLAGTDEVGTSELALSMSPDGKYLLMLTVAKPFEDRPSTWTHGVQTLDIATGEMIKHLPSTEMAKSDLEMVRRSLRTIGFVSFFAEDGWYENKFYLRGASRALIDPTQVYFALVRVDPPEGARSSDCIERGILARFEEDARKSGALTDAPLLAIDTSSGLARGMFAAPASVFTTSPAIYYCGYDSPGRVYRCDGKASEVVFSNEPGFLLANPSLDMIKVSPDGKYLAAVYRKKLGLPVPSPGGAYELSVTELTGAKRIRYWGAEYFGSCVWDPTSTVLYFVSTCRGLGVYRLNIDAAF